MKMASVHDGFLLHWFIRIHSIEGTTVVHRCSQQHAWSTNSFFNISVMTEGLLTLDIIGLLSIIKIQSNYVICDHTETTLQDGRFHCCSCVSVKSLHTDTFIGLHKRTEFEFICLCMLFIHFSKRSGYAIVAFSKILESLYSRFSSCA